MANHVNVQAIGELIEQEPFDFGWFSYDLGGGWGSRLTKYKKKGAAQGIFTPGIGNEVGIPKVYKKLKNGDFSDIAGFYVAILAFFGEKVYENLDFVEKIPKNSINKVVSALQCPERFKDEIYEICHTKFDFLDFISAAAKLEKTNFDENSAIAVYKLQGDAVIFPLLCQMFYNNKGITQFSTCLIKQLPVQLPMEVSDYLSGCHFPVVVSPYVDDFFWEENDNGWFLYANYEGEKVVVDVAGIGRVQLSNYALGNRINYLGGGGRVLPFLICWNWGEVVEAYHFFGSDLLIRDMKNDLFYHYWFKFGPKSKLNVSFKGDFINGSGDFSVVPSFSTNLITNKDNYIITNLDGDFVDYCDKNDVFYSKSEIFDWFELGKMLK